MGWSPATRPRHPGPMPARGPARAFPFRPGTMRVLLALLAPLLAVAAGAGAQTAGPAPQPEHMPPAVAMTPAEIEGRAARRFPQPVRAGALAGRALLEPVEAQPILGRVVGLAARDDGGRGVVIRLDGRWGLGWLGPGGLDLGWSGFGPRLVSVPVAAVALMGEHVALMDLTPAQLRALPTLPPDAAAGIPADERVPIGIVRPFH